MIYPVLINPVYLELIRNGAKTVEGRVKKPPYDGIQSGDRILFRSTQNSTDELICLVKLATVYTSFEEMLLAEGIKNCLPKQSSLAVAVQLYYSFPNYEKDSKRLGVIAYRILPI